MTSVFQSLRPSVAHTIQFGTRRASLSWYLKIKNRHISSFQLKEQKTKWFSLNLTQIQNNFNLFKHLIQKGHQQQLYKWIHNTMPAPLMQKLNSLSWLQACVSTRFKSSPTKKTWTAIPLSQWPTSRPSRSFLWSLSQPWTTRTSDTSLLGVLVGLFTCTKLIFFSSALRFQWRELRLSMKTPLPGCATFIWEMARTICVRPRSTKILGYSMSNIQPIALRKTSKWKA